MILREVILTENQKLRKLSTEGVWNPHHETGPHIPSGKGTRKYSLLQRSKFQLSLNHSVCLHDTQYFSKKRLLIGR